MVRIEKSMQQKHKESLSPWVKDFVTEASSASSVPLPLLPEYLRTFPTRWPFPRGDLYHWIPLLNRFDTILEKFVAIYSLQTPQMRDFATELLETEKWKDEHDLVKLGYERDGDRQLVMAVLDFSKLLFENCGNRSIYASSPHLECLLNTTSLPLLASTLALCSQLAQRYNASLKKMSGSARHMSSALLANHYNIQLDRVVELAQPFSKTAIKVEPQAPQTPVTPSVKGKEKGHFGSPAATQKPVTVTTYATDLVAMAKGTSSAGNSPQTVRRSSSSAALPSSSQAGSWEEWGNVRFTYYPKPSASETVPSGSTSTDAAPATPSLRLSSRRLTMAQHQLQDTHEPPPVAAVAVPNGAKVLEVPSYKIASSSLHEILNEYLPGVPDSATFEFLSKLRVAKALMESEETRRQILAIRILAITNLAWIHSETVLHEKVLKHDSEEPRRLQLVYQLTELLHDSATKDGGIPRGLQTIAMDALYALAQHSTKHSDVCGALSTHLSHGVILYIVRRAVAEMSEPESTQAQDEWRNSLFTLLQHVVSLMRAGQDLVTAGLMPILVEVLTLRTEAAERTYPRVLSLFENIVYNVRDAVMSLVNANGLDAISDLCVHEVKSASELAVSGTGLPSNQRSAAVDFQIQFFQQQTLKWLFKFIHRMMTTSGGFGTNLDRLLRNLIDSSALLGSLREVIEHGSRFGSSVWTNAVHILIDFVNNEPTSFAVIAEAGLSRAVLEAVMNKPIDMPSETKETQSLDEAADEADSPARTDEDAGASVVEDNLPHPPTAEMLEAPRGHKLAGGILPSVEAINVIPQAFSAICLNPAGMKMFQASNALASFFEIFESYEHVKCLESDRDDTAAGLGSAFDELFRHHPSLTKTIMNATIDMVARVVHLCKAKAAEDKQGAKLWIIDASGKLVAAGDASSEPVSATGKGKEKAISDDVEMKDVPEDTRPSNVRPAASDADASVTPYVTALASFLYSMLAGVRVRTKFMESGGSELVLDLAELPSLSYDFADARASMTLNGLIAQLAEQKPQLIMPSLLRRAQSAADTLAPFVTHDGPQPYFAPFVTQDRPADEELIRNGTTMTKALVNIHSLTAALEQCIHTPVYASTRTASTNFNQLNLADYYVRFVTSLGPLLGASVKEGLKLPKVVPEHWKRATRTKDSGPGVTLLDELLGGESASQVAQPAIEPAAGNDQTPQNGPQRPADSPAPLVDGPSAKSAETGPEKAVVTKHERSSPKFKNFQTLRYLFSKMEGTVAPLFQSLGKALLSKRNPDAYQRQSHGDIANALAETIFKQLTSEIDGPVTERYSFWVVMVTTLREMLVDVSRQSEHAVAAITLVLQAFKEKGGFVALNKILETLARDIRENPIPADGSSTVSSEGTAKHSVAILGCTKILDLYAILAAGTTITESVQTVAITSRAERDRSKPDYFSPAQFLVEIRMSILPVVRSLWESDFVETAPSSLANKLIDIIRKVATADREGGAYRRTDKIPVHPQIPRKTWRISPDSLLRLTDAGHADELTREALFRCNNTFSVANEYCFAVEREHAGRYPPPPNEIDDSHSRPRTSTSTGTATPDANAMALDEASRPPRRTAEELAAAAADIRQAALAEAARNREDEPMTGNLDRLLSDIAANFDSPEAGLPSSVRSQPSTSSDARIVTLSPTQMNMVTLDDLDAERTAVRVKLIDRCLDVINAHGEVTFETSDLINTVVSSSPDPPAMRKEMGETLVNALMSFAAEDDVRTVGKKVAAYAHLLALMLQSKEFYAACIDELKENIFTLIGFVKLSSEHSEDSSPWIANILLVLETLLSEDAQPLETIWKAPTSDSDVIQAPVLKVKASVVSDEARMQLLEAILDVLHRVGKDESLAVALVRILVILTRSRQIAQKMGERKNIQRLFVMAKQLAGAPTQKIYSPLMLILRHIIEDEETVKQIMRSGIKTYFEASRPSRGHPVDVQTYLRVLSHLVIRSPTLFVDVSNEMVKLSRWGPSSADNPARQQLVLKESSQESVPKTDDAVLPTVQATEDLSIQDVKTSAGVQTSDKPKATATEQKMPVVENPDGVVHFLISELLNYKDVDDKDPGQAAEVDKTASEKSGPSADASTPAAPAAGENTSSGDSKDAKKAQKSEFKLEQHPIYLYRCFLLQCLTELLACYNRTKIEFINFKRSALPSGSTPSKPRSGVINYLLCDLIPVGTLEHPENITMRKRFTTSAWADSVMTALLSKTGEQIPDLVRDPSDGEDEPDLLFVRKFVLENLLRTYKEATMSSEPLEIKYARMLSLSDLMAHIMAGKDNLGGGVDTALNTRSTLQLKRIMYEKGFIAALTTSIADVDLNFPGAKRAVKYILRPLKVLTQTAIDLSELSIVTAPGQADEDEISSASSVSDGDEREETPDLFRNSTLGMFEPGRESSSSDDDDDEDQEMYEGEFDDEGMEYEEDIAEDDEDDISEDEDMEGMGPIEGIDGDHGVDVEVIMGEGEGDDTDEDEDEDSDDDMDEDSDDDDEDDHEHVEIDIVDEDGARVQVEGDEDDWQSADEDDNEEEEDYEGQAADEEEARIHDIDMAQGPLGHLVRALNGDELDGGLLQRVIDEQDMDAEGQMDLDGYMDDVQDDEEDDEAEEDMDDEERMYEDDYPGPGHLPLPFGWESEVLDAPVVIAPRGHHHHRPRLGLPSPFPLFAGPHDPLGVPAFRSYRSHRPSAAPRSNTDDGVNPLLQRGNNSGRESSGRPGPGSNWIQAMSPSGHLLGIDIGGPSAPADFLRELISSLPHTGGPRGHGHAFQFHVTGPRGDMTRELQSMFGLTRSRFDTRRNESASPEAAFFTPQSTSARWTDEAKLLFGSSVNDKAGKIINGLMAVFIPPAIEEAKKQKAEAEKVRKEKEEEQKRLAEEKAAKEAKEAEEKAAREKKEAEEREAAQRAAAEAAASAGADNAEATGDAPEDAEAMEGVEPTSSTADAGTNTGGQEPAADRPRVMTNLRGTPFDITDLGIDAEFLQELPEELREEVIMSRVAERRSEAAAAGTQPADIDQEFLDALPEDIREEIIASERQDRRRREREEQRRQAAANAPGGVNIEAVEMAAADILATFPPELRQQVLMEQDEEVIAHLPPEVAAQARALARRHEENAAQRYNRAPAAGAAGGAAQISVDDASRRPQRRAIVQMLDKAGVATLLRLMFVSQQGSLRTTLCSVLKHVSENRTNRSEIITTILHILQDGSVDMSAVERSFAQLSVRAKQPPKDKDPKSPAPLKRTLTGGDVSSLATTSTEVSPLMVVQQCLHALVYLCQENAHVAPFFLTEHESTGAILKRTMSRKGKAKDTKSTKYAINSLLSLLDRNIITESSSVMENLSDLLNRITQPLQALERRQKEAEESSKTEAAPPAQENANAAAAVGEPAQPQPSSTEAAGQDAPAEQPATEAGQASAAAPESKSEESAKEAEKKKQRSSITPPSIPEHNLKLVINIFVARECSAKTFRETISTIKNLSAIPGAKEVFGRELIRKAQDLGRSILSDLNELLPQIQKASTSTEIQGVALANFSQTSSDQNKLLRVLTALDHLFDPKSQPKRDEEAAGSSAKDMEKQDLLASLYNSATFGPMWDKLSACLSAIRRRDHMLNVATILLPLIESLMVVCKKTTIKDIAPSLAPAKEMSLSSPEPEARMENLFFTFTGEHRKILNELVRQSPKLMSGTFSLLVKNPKVLEFDNKRNYFTRSLHNRNAPTRQSYPPLQLSVRRDQVFLDSFKALYFKSGDELKFGKLSIRFHGEEGVDAGGVTREWFQVMSRQMFDPGYALFIPVSSDRTTFHPNLTSSINPEHLTFFKFIGRVIAKALYEGRVLDCHFSRAVYKRILGKSVSVKDMESLDPDYYKSLIWMLENDITDVITETMSVDNDKFGEVETVDLIENGRNIPVTEENKQEYIRLVVEFKLTGSVQDQLDNFLKGFHDIIPAELISIFNEQELELLISGLPEIDVDDWKSNAEYHNYTASSPQIRWFWRAVRSFDKEEKAKLLQFVTGTSKVPLNGFKELEGMNGFSRFNIHRDYGPKDRLPSSHTCFNQLDLPEYLSYDTLRAQLLTAITAGSEYFGFA